MCKRPKTGFFQVIWAAGLLGAAGLSGCSALQAPNDRAQALLAAHGFEQLPMRADTLAALTPPKLAARGPNWISVFIEGDGAAWPQPWLPPTDPTPSKPIGLQLAVAHASIMQPGEAVAYLGRPCQYLNAAALASCPPAWWTLGRFGNEPLARLNARLDELTAKAPGAKLQLIGYSGGGAVAALLASQRPGVTCLVTVAAPLDTTAWTRAKNVSPLSQSRNPLDAASLLRGLPATHFSGSQDNTVPAGVNQRFLDASQSRETRLPGYGHETPWVKTWAALAAQSCLSK